MSEEKREENPVLDSLDKIIEASSNFLRAIFPPLFKMAEMKKEKAETEE